MWYQNLIQYLKELGFTMIESDKCVMVLHGPLSSNGSLAMIAIYVHDCIVMSPSMELINELKSKFHNKYSIKDLGEAKWMLKIQIERMRERDLEVLWMGQPLYVTKFLDPFWAWIPSTENYNSYDGFLEARC
jgi:Reverse transcriptase (RNA-dependent DNA polymerase)